jgi:hypothetical protein
MNYDHGANLDHLEDQLSSLALQGGGSFQRQDFFKSDENHNLFTVNEEMTSLFRQSRRQVNFGVSHQ